VNHTDIGGRNYCEVRDRTEELAAPLSAEDQVVQSMPDSSPTKWHRAHTTWFFEEFVLGPHAAGYRVVDPDHRFLFNSYYEAVGARQPRPRRGMITRPSAAQVGHYRRRVDDSMVALVDRGVDPEVAGLVELGLHHEEQHQELLLMDAKHLLFQNPLRPAYRADPDPDPGAAPSRRAASAAPTPAAAGWLAHDGGLVEVGHDGHGFAYDNEGPRHTTYQAPFAVADRLVTGGDWLEFMDDGGYDRVDLWLSDGWATVQAEAWDAPLYWDQDADGGWEVFTLDGPRPVDPSEPVVHVSMYEADAYARWRGARLPTEAEWELVARDRWGRDTRRDGGATLHPVPAGSAADPLGFQGQVWQWTASAYLPYPGFRAAPGAVGEYNGKFMVNQHVLRGGCCATPVGHSRPTYRNFYPPGSRWMFSGLRLATDG
jgi:ergothioneine biosynthesis protein EgtB